MTASGQQALSNFYSSVTCRDPLLASLMSEDVIAVAIYSLALNNDYGQVAANRLREKSQDLPELLRRILETALMELGYS